MLLSITRFSLYFILIFSPLAVASVQGWAIGVIHFVTLFALAALLCDKSLKWEWEWIRTPLDKPLFCLLVFCFLSSIFSVHKYSSIWSFILLLNYLIIFYMTVHTVRSRYQLRQLVYLIIFVAAFLSIFGLIKKFGNFTFPWGDYSFMKPNANIVSATYVNPNHFAGYMEMTIPLLLGLFLTGFRGIKFFSMIVLAALFFTALILSLSRGGWFAAFAGLLFMSFALLFNPYFQSKKLVLTLVCGCLIVAFIVLSSTPVVKEIKTLEQMGIVPSLNDRITVWGGIVKMIKDHPVLGTGPGTFSTVFTQYQPPGLMARYFAGHNDYLHFISETGFVLVPIMVWMMISLFVKGFKKLNYAGRLVRGTTLGAMSGVIAILVHSIFDFNLHIPANAILFTTLAAIVVSPISMPSDQMTDH